MSEQLELVDGTDHVESVANGYSARMSVVLDRHDSYHPDVLSRRNVADEYHFAARKLRSAAMFLGGDYDSTYAGPLGDLYGDLEGYRLHYADSCLRDALHHIVWAEYWAGIRTREAACDEDPFRR